jgi:predicted transcriptional regulator of viral defense system
MTTKAKIERRIASAPPGHLFSIEDFLAIASPAAVKTAVSRLSKGGTIERVRRGLYCKPRVSRFGRTTASPESIAIAVVDGKAPGPAGASAAAALGLSTQIPAFLTIAVVGRPPTSVSNVGFVERSNFERVAAGLRSTEIALLEVLRDDLRWVELSKDELRHRIGALVDCGDIDVRRLRRAAKREPHRVREHLKMLLPAKMLPPA